MSSIQCYHAFAFITWAWCKLFFELFNHQCFSRDLFLEYYKYIVKPISGEEEWKETPYPKPLPPEVKPQTGRPKNKWRQMTYLVLMQVSWKEWTLLSNVPIALSMVIIQGPVQQKYFTNILIMMPCTSFLHTNIFLC